MTERALPVVHDLVVVGAGMAGLTAARHVVSLGFDVVVLDKGRAVGGRMATRRWSGARFDHGAQHFSARSHAFRTEVAAWLQDGVARVWFESQSITQPDRGIEPRHAGVDGMRGIPEHLADGLDVHTEMLVDGIDSGRLVTAWCGEERFTGRGALLTAPLPQTLDLVRRSRLPLPASDLQSLQAVAYDATLAVMAVLDGPSGLEDGHVAFDEGPVAWVGDNHHKGVSTLPAITVHSSAQFAATHLDDDVADWAGLLTAEVERRLGVVVLASAGHRWRYSQPRTTLDGPVVAPGPAPIVLAGEVFAGARVEGAFLSGIAAADILAERLG